MADPVAGQHYAGKFVFEVDGLEIGAFQEVSGLSVQVEVQTVQEGGLNDYEHKLPGRMKWPNLKLKRGVTDSDALFGWLNKSSGEGLAGIGYKLERSTGRISLLDAAYNTVRTWEFEGAFPVKWTGPSLSASNNDIAVEELEIAHHGFRSSG